MADLETQMQEVIDREAIRNLPLQYCHCVWQKDLDGYANLFTEDGSFTIDNPDLPGAQGRDNLRKMIASGLDDIQPRPFIHNHVIELTGPDSATGTCYVEVHMNRDRVDRPRPRHRHLLRRGPHGGQEVGDAGLV
jgi:uncharacterized protein (TIGR02246 family)